MSTNYKTPCMYALHTLWVPNLGVGSHKASRGGGGHEAHGAHVERLPHAAGAPHGKGN